MGFWDSSGTLESAEGGYFQNYNSAKLLLIACTSAAKVLLIACTSILYLEKAAFDTLFVMVHLDN